MLVVKPTLLVMDRTSYELIRTIEEISLNAWPSLQQILYDGWILRFANGHTKRANSVNPVYKGSQNVYEKIKRCQEVYSSKNLTTIFRITPLARPENLDEILKASGFEKKDISCVQVKDLEVFQPQPISTIRFWTKFSQEWLENFAYLREIPLEEQELLKSILHNIASEKCFAVLIKDNQVVACGLGVLENQYIGLFEIITAKDKRRKGYGRELILSILSWAKNKGATKAYLQVVVTNEAALKLYSDLGFQEIYQYFYRIKSN
jgi:ribosomal protein S18 acetylase RimI-like enzyme